MAKIKKNFRSGLDSLIGGSLGNDDEEEVRRPQKQHNNAPQPAETAPDETPEPKEENPVQTVNIEQVAANNEEIKNLHLRIANLNQELYLWRTGRVTQDNFETSLRKFGLRYNKESNEIEKVE